MAVNTYDFAGWATKVNVVCTDGRTIAKDAFKHMDGKRVPLVWQHLHNEPANILGHAILEHRADGVYAYCVFNNGAPAQQARQVVAHKDIESLSIYANGLVEKSKIVHKGNIREVSLVLAGANPGAVIDYLNFAHNDDESVISEDEAIITMDLGIDFPEAKHGDDNTNEEAAIEHAAEEDATVDSVVASMTDIQRKVFYAIVAKALESQSGDELSQSDQLGENFMKTNVFNASDDGGPRLTHAQLTEFATTVFKEAKDRGSFRDAFLAHAGTYGIDNIGDLFPDARLLDNEPSFETRRMGWVKNWMAGTRHTPFSRIKKIWADLTPEAARAKGYITGNEKVEQVFAVLKRVTEPTTVYKKQKLDRDDIVDITDFDVVAWMWKELRFMLEEEVARAGLIGDGRTFGTDDDAINPEKIRPIYGDSSVFVHYLTLEATVTDWIQIIDAIQTARVNYKGTGLPNLYVPNTVFNGMLLVRDSQKRRIYRTVAELASELRVNDIIEVEPMEGLSRDNESPAYTADLLAIMVNPYDYTYGSDKGGQMNTFSDFDIDFNQEKYLIETRLSGSLLMPKSAMVVERKQAVGGG
jgi:hypothetical protein